MFVNCPACQNLLLIQCYPDKTEIIAITCPDCKTIFDYEIKSRNYEINFTDVENLEKIYDQAMSATDVADDDNWTWEGYEYTSNWYAADHISYDDHLEYKRREAVAKAGTRQILSRAFQHRGSGK
jgi:transcription elongation factor Elf1